MQGCLRRFFEGALEAATVVPSMQRAGEADPERRYSGPARRGWASVCGMRSGCSFRPCDGPKRNRTRQASRGDSRCMQINIAEGGGIPSSRWGHLGGVGSRARLGAVAATPPGAGRAATRRCSRAASEIYRRCLELVQKYDSTRGVVLCIFQAKRGVHGLFGCYLDTAVPRSSPEAPI